MWRYLLLYACLSLCSISLQAQDGSKPVAPEKGMPFIQNFPPSAYQGHRQNWCILQDHKGILYVGNTTGLLTYDGVNWRRYSSPNASVVRYLAMDSQGQIYYGAKGDFGYISSDSVGRLTMTSLLEKIPDSLRQFKDIWRISCGEKEVYFHCHDYLFRIGKAYAFSDKQSPTASAGDFSYWRYSRWIISANAMIGDTLYFHDMNVGFKRIVKGQVEIVPGSEIINQLQVADILSFPASSPAFPKQLFISTQEDGLFLYDGESVQPFVLDAAAQKLLAHNLVLSVILLPEDLLCLSTTQHGLVVLTTEGKLVSVIDKSAGLPSNTVLFAHRDQQGGIWLGTNNGLSRVELLSPFSTLPNLTGLEGNVYSFQRHDKKIFVGTSSGLFKTSTSAPPEWTNFQQVGNIRSSYFGLLSTGEELLGAIPSEGIVAIEQDQLSLIKETIPLRLSHSRFDSNLILVAESSPDKGFGLIYRMETEWMYKTIKPSVPTEIRYLGEEAPGVIWLGSRTKGYFRLEIPSLLTPEKLQEQGPTLTAKVEQIGNNINVTGGRARLFNVYDHLYLATNKGLKRFDTVTRTLLPDTSLGAALADTTAEINLLVEGINREIWIKSTLSDNGFNKLVPTQEGSYQLEELPLMNRVADRRLSNIHHDPKFPGTFWFGGSEELIKLTPAPTQTHKAEFSAFIRKVTINGDSLIYGGDWLNPRKEFVTPKFSYSGNMIRFEYAATSFELPEKTTYQVWLEGFDKAWSDWTEETQKDYTNLPEGKYVFWVRARNLYGVLSEDTSFSYSITPPWYRTWVAYLFYLVLFLGSMFWLVRFRERRLKLQNRALEAIITDRTKELAAKNEKLQEMDEMKSRFFTNISHELRTPISLILGPASHILQHFSPRLGKEGKEIMQLIERNGQSLLNLVEELLEIAKLDAGKSELNEKTIAFYPFCRQLFSAFESMAAFKHISYRFDFELAEDLHLSLDVTRLQKIINNLLSNALKFSDEGESVTLRVFRHEAAIFIAVQDSGRGIPSEDLPHVFDRFFQTKIATISTEGGTGVGLSLSQELAHLMEGELTVESEWGKGSTFTLRFPAKEAIAPPVITLPIPASITQGDQDEVKGNLPAPPATAAKILIVEDNPDMQFMIQTLLGTTYECILAKDGQAAWELLEQNHPSIKDISLILSDVMMPRMDGYRLLERIKAHPTWRQLPIMMLTARAAEADKLSALRMGVDDYLLKPFSAPELEARIANLIENHLARIEFQSTAPSREPSPMDISFEEVPEADALWLQQIEAAALEALEKGLDLSTGYLADKMALSDRQMLRRVKALTGLSVNQYLQEVKLQKARHLLENKAFTTISEVAYHVGFNTPGYFSKVFEKRFGKRPGAY